MPHALNRDAVVIDRVRCVPYPYPAESRGWMARIEVRWRGESRSAVALWPTPRLAKAKARECMRFEIAHRIRQESSWQQSVRDFAAETL